MPCIDSLAANKGQKPHKLGGFGLAFLSLDVATPVSVASTAALFLFASLMQDKQEPNDLRTAKRVVESIEDNLTEEDSLAGVTQLVAVHLEICQHVA